MAAMDMPAASAPVSFVVRPAVEGREAPIGVGDADSPIAGGAFVFDAAVETVAVDLVVL